MQDRSDELIKASLDNKTKSVYRPLEGYSTSELKKELRIRKAER